MKKVITGGLLACFLAMGIFAFKSMDPKKEHKTLEIGEAAPKTDFKMMDVSGKDITLDAAKKENGLLVIFSCNTCPFVVGNGTKSEGWEGRYPELAKIASSDEIGMVMVNSNEAKRDKGDNLKDMQARYKEQGLKGYYVLDKRHELADAFGALTTPHVFLFDKEMNLVYKGAIDDSVDRAAAVEEPYLKNAMDALVNGKEINPNSTRQLGCSIKRVS